MQAGRTLTAPFAGKRRIAARQQRRRRLPLEGTAAGGGHHRKRANNSADGAKLSQKDAGISISWRRKRRDLETMK